MRFAVYLEPYRLDANHVGEDIYKPVLVSRHRSPLYAASVIEYLGVKTDRWSKNKTETHYVASVAQRGNSEKPSRREVDLNNLMPDTPEARAAFEHYMTKVEARKQAEIEEREAFRAIPRLSVDDIQPLVELYKRDQ